LLIRDREDISNIINIGTARGHSAVCAARALEERDRDGIVHTIDIRPSDKPQIWRHNDSDIENDLAEGKKMTVNELIGKVYPKDSTVDIVHHTGDSNNILSNWTDYPPDLIFHDGRHAYENVKNDIRFVNDAFKKLPIHVFDDCYLYHSQTQFQPVDATTFDTLHHISKVQSAIRRTHQYSIQKRRHPGIKQAVKEEFVSDRLYDLEIIHNTGHAAITTLIPE
jgi:hypothetical protein